MMALLNEQKSALIQRAVTRGLDPNARFKNSGLPWLGQVPEHWEVLPLKKFARFKSGAGFPVNEQGNAKNPIPFFKVSDMTSDGNERWLVSCLNSITSDTARRLGAYIFPENSIVFPKVGGAMLTNKRRLLTKKSCIDNNIMACMVFNADLEFAFIVLEQLDLANFSKPGPVPAIGEGEVKNIKVPIPPISEQRAIVAHIEAESAQLNAALERIGREIALIGEYRTRLVCDVVTGQWDVRAIVATSPDIEDAGAAPALGEMSDDDEIEDDLGDLDE